MKYLTITLILAMILVVSGCTEVTPVSPELAKHEVTIFKSASCGCCGGFAQYAKDKGMNIKINVIEDIEPIKKQFKISDELRSCHTSVIDKYFVEGHVPTEAIEKLMKEKPDIAGISLPGMPAGSPGMPGEKSETWVVFAVHHDGKISEFMKI